jgi:hypothetical protein
MTPPLTAEEREEQSMQRISFTKDELDALLDRVSSGYECQEEGTEAAQFWSRLLDKIERAVIREKASP